MNCLKALAIAALALGFAAFPATAQTSGVTSASSSGNNSPAAALFDHDEAFPSSGLGARTVGERVLLFSDGTWKVDQYYSADQVTAVSDHGRIVSLTRTIDPKTKEPVLRWNYARGHGGPLQIVVSRAITTDRSEHSKNDNCIPVITVRNLTNLGLFRIVAELQFDGAGEEVHASTSVMAGPLDDGEQGDYLSSPLFIDTCSGLTARLHIPFCQFENGLDCRDVVAASAFGTIPAVLAPTEQASGTQTSN
ncbi:hypothetical protein [Nisaea sp.]|uniref:hypothetical protein n=1 Tax=Nisaea sp. TaxID=2024842 RepID=UPI003B5220DC